MRPTIYMVAEEAGVSIATVSRAFNNHPRISEETRQKIFGIADALGYYPSASARNLSNRTTETIAVVLTQTSTPFFSDMIRGIENVCRERQYHLLIYTCLDLDASDSFLSLLPSRVDGIVICAYSSTGQFINRLYNQRFPFILLGESSRGLPINTIRPENRAGAYRLMQHLILQHGYKKIAFISGPKNQEHSVERLWGYLQALKEYSLPFNEEWILTGNFEESSGYDCTMQLLGLADPPRAIFAANDAMAIGAMAAAAKMGYAVPEDLAVVGFNNISSSQYLRPALTTVCVDTAEQGKKAVIQLLECIANPDTPRQDIIIETPIILRNSCGCK